MVTNTQFDNQVGQVFRSSEIYSDPLLWQQELLGVNLFSNQYDITDALFDPKLPNFNILGSRGSGKTQGLSYGLTAMCAIKPKTHIITAAPIAPQAGRILRYVKIAMNDDRSRVRDMVDWQGSSAYRMQWKNGSTIVAVSGQEKASSEGEHGNILVVDEAHLVAGRSMSAKLQPMIMSLDGAKSKIIKIGVAMGKGHFYKTVMAPGARNCMCPWNKAEIFLVEDDPMFYKGVQYSRQLVNFMPLEYKLKYFPARYAKDGTDLHKITGLEISVLDWMTQYELEWVDDINNLLSEKDHNTLASGEHMPMTKGASNERYFGGLDTAGGSITGRTDTDRTVLSIWRLRKNGMVDRVAAFQWVGNIVEQKQEIWDICNPKNGLFRCEIIMADHSNIAQEMIPTFRQMGMPIVGVAFGGSAKAYGSVKNWKNTLVDHFMVNLQSGLIHYPNVDKMKQRGIEAREDELVQLENMMEGFGEWGVVQRIRSKGGLNDQIAAPTETLDDEAGGVSRVFHDDHVMADIMAAFAARYADRLKKDLTKSGGLIGYEIPHGVVGGATTSAFGPTAVHAAGGNNPLAQQARQQLASPPGESGGDSESIISSFISMNIKK